MDSSCCVRDGFRFRKFFLVPTGKGRSDGYLPPVSSPSHGRLPPAPPLSLPPSLSLSPPLAAALPNPATGNFPTVTRVLLSKIPQTDGRMTYVYDSYVFHYIVEDGICYLCMSDEQGKHRVPYALLGDVKERFLARYGLEEATRAIAFSLNEEFSPVLEERMGHYNGGGAADRIDEVKSQIDDVRDVMVQNIEKVLERGEKIELLVDRTDRLNQQAYRFEASSRSLRRAVEWRRLRCRLMGGAAVLVLVWMFAAGACGGIFFSKCRRGS